MHAITTRPRFDAQVYVHCDGIHIGYHIPGGPVNFISQVPDSVRTACVEHFEKLEGKPPQTAEPPPYAWVEEAAALGPADDDDDT